MCSQNVYNRARNLVSDLFKTIRSEYLPQTSDETAENPLSVFNNSDKTDIYIKQSILYELVLNFTSSVIIIFLDTNKI